ncbi:MAG: glycoside hydrolase family 20, partial [Deltaproteobacteria bacterium]|nr:glycoside hydrolase family 20 [Deltaproteobacteria bacterium]
MKATPACIIACIFVLVSCTSGNKPEGEFRLLPQPQLFEITGTSAIKHSDIVQYHITGNIELPVRGEKLKNIRASDNPQDAQIICSIDASLDTKEEGYTLAISKDQINIIARDKAGLLYAFMTLEQLMEDSEEQSVPLPLCSIKDYPLLSYRAIHIDVKHHRETIEYYYQLMDKLAGYKVNAIIAEMEDKLKYERQPALGSADALSIKEKKKLSEYAMERNIEISPLIQGLGHASFILKHDIYKDIRDDPQSDWAFDPLNPKTYEVQFDLYRDALDATPYGR